MFSEAISRVFCCNLGIEVEIVELYSVEKGTACPVASLLVASRCREQERCASAGSAGCHLKRIEGGWYEL